MKEGQEVEKRGKAEMVWGEAPMPRRLSIPETNPRKAGFGSGKAVKMTLICHRFRSNQVRLRLSVIAYNLAVAADGAAEED